MTGVSWCAAGCTIVETVAKCSLFMDGIAIYGSLFLKLWHPLKRADPANTAVCMHSTPDSGIRQREGHKGATKGSCLFSQSEIMKHSARQMKRGSRIIL